MKETLHSTNPNALVQVGVHIVIAVIFGQVHQDSGSAAAISGPAEAAVADAPARRAPPLLTGETRAVRLDPHTNAPDRSTAKCCSLPNSAEHLGPPLRSGCGDRGRRTGPGRQRTRGSDSWSWCQSFSGGTGGKWFPAQMRAFLTALFRQRLVTNAFLGLRARGTHCGAVVHFLSHVVADVLQLQFCDVIHRSHHMRESPGPIEGPAAELRRKEVAAHTGLDLWKP